MDLRGCAVLMFLTCYTRLGTSSLTIQIVEIELLLVCIRKPPHYPLLVCGFDAALPLRAICQILSDRNTCTLAILCAMFLSLT
jgi:hypothetical protein